MPGSSQTIILNSEQETVNFACTAAKSLKGDETILLKGDLGTGKTFFTREIIKYFCGEEVNVTSPTFNILQIYKATNFDIYHYDLYRLKNKNELFELAFEEAMHSNLCLIEWPEIASNFINSPFVEIHFSIDKDNVNSCSRLCSINYK